MRLHRAACVIACAVCACSPFNASSDDAGAADASNGGGGPASSCKALLAQQPTLKGKNAIYDLDGYKGYCDMTLDGGGWTLVGRSAPTAVATAFGWRSNSGDVSMLDNAYSLDVTAVRLTFAEVLVAVRPDTAFDAAERAYRFAVAPDFIAAHGTDLFVTVSTPTVIGDCTPVSRGPTMLKYAGATSITDDFFFRDVPDSSQHQGLQPDGFHLAYDDCTQGGYMNKRQGLVLVR